MRAAMLIEAVERELRRFWRYRLWELHRELRELNRKRAEALDKAEKEKGSRLTEEELSGVLAEWNWQFDSIEGAIVSARTEQLRKQADALFLDLPPHDDGDKWEPNYAVGAHVLTNAGVREVTAAIRQAKLERLELWKARAAIIGPVITAVTGLVGALIGLFSMFR